MPNAREIYQLHPEQYDALVRCEDRHGNLLVAIRGLASLETAEVVELGAGTGRLTALLAPHVRSIRAFDLAAPMLAVARHNLEQRATGNWSLGVADNARLPLPDATADLAIAGWAFGHQTVWSPDRWQPPIEAAVGEMDRVLRPGGTAIVIETLGTGHAEPFEPPAELARYYALLAGPLGFTRTWIRTDYHFPSPAEGVRLLRFFFGDPLARRFAASGGRALPECTGLWSRRK